MAGRIIRAPKLVIFNLPWSVGPRELREYFAKFGPVSFSDVKFDRATGFSRGFGFIEYSISEDTQKCLEISEHVLEGNILNIRRTTDN